MPTPRLTDPDLLAAFLAVVDTRSFTAAAKRIGVGQSAISQKIARLEAELGRRLFARDTHSVSVTVQGAALEPFAREVIASHQRLDQAVSGRRLRGLVRLGVSEDFALAGLAEILADFRHRHEEVEIEMMIGLSGLLNEAYDRRQLDVVFAKRAKGDRRGRVAWREDLVWVGPSRLGPAPASPLPLVLYPPPSVTRALALDALRHEGWDWKIVCTASSISGLRAATLAGLGFTPHSRRLIPPGLAAVPASVGLPALGTIEFIVLGRAEPGSPAAALADALLDGAGRIAGPAG